MRSFSINNFFKAVLLVLSVYALQANASAPMTDTQAPGYYNFMLGKFEVTALNDGTVDLPTDKLLHQPAEKTVKELHRAFMTVPTETSVNGFLINTGKRLVLIDTGAGSFFGPTLGNLVSNLKAAGYSPDQVDDIFITHMHADHVGGLVNNGARVFPNAVIHINKKDTDYWLSQTNMDKAPEDSKGFFKSAMAALKPYEDAKKLDSFSGNKELVPGISSDESFGHTPGHTSYVVESDGQKLLVIGDLIHVAAVQFAHPQVTIGFDSEPKLAEKSRMRIFDQVAKNGTLIAGAHLQFPGLGHLHKHGKGFTWIPANYMRMPKH